MDGFLVLLAIIGWIISKSNKKKKKASRPKNTQRYINAAKRAGQTLQQAFDDWEDRRMTQLKASATKTVQQPVGEGESVSYDMRSELGMEPAFRGSLDAETFEGECICDPELEHAREMEAVTESVYANQIGREPLVDFSSKGILQGVVMNEILTRPAQRGRRMH